MNPRGRPFVAVLACLAFLAGLAGPACSSGDGPGSAVPPDRPSLAFQDPGVQALLGTAFDSALHNLLDLNTRPFDPAVDRTGLMTDPSGRYLVAGGDYPDPWTRDTAFMGWDAASLLEPGPAANTYWAVCERQDDGRLVVRRDLQWWDKVIWVTGAWHHYQVTGDGVFLARAYEATVATLEEMEGGHFNAEEGLFEGPGVIGDSAAAYPAPPFDPAAGSSFILDHPGSERLLTFSTNVLYFHAYRVAARMAAVLGRPAAEVEAFDDRAARLRDRINQRFWLPDAGRYGYFVHGEGGRRGELEEHQESLGLALAILLGVADVDRAASILRGAVVLPKGIPHIHPHFARYDDGHPGRGNVILWVNTQGMWAWAAATQGRVDLFRNETQQIAETVHRSGDDFRELYDCWTGEPNGGWQVSHGPVEVPWPSAVSQGWSATAFLKLVFAGLFGMEFQADGIRFAPRLPADWGEVTLRDLRYRGMSLAITLTGAGTVVESFEVDGERRADSFLGASGTGAHRIRIRLAGEGGTNVAPLATATASSVAPSSSAGGVNDGRRDGAATAGAGAGEWTSHGETVGAWVRLDWTTPRTVGRARLYDRAAPGDPVDAGTLSFSDGTSVPVVSLVDSGAVGTDVVFPPRAVTWVRFTVDRVRAGAQRTGLAELQVFEGE